jgi:2-oxoglutarate ferredoxin oxidoreductase subunit gamma
MSRILIAGFGGQGILFAGKFLAYQGLIEGREVSWLPSYGPEMRGGTANCSVILSTDPIGSPIVNNPDILITMNLPSLDKFENAAVPGARVFVDSSFIERKVGRADLESYYIPATRMAHENGLDGLANMIMIGKVIKETGIVPYETVPEAMEMSVSAKKKKLYELNLKAIELGYGY